MEKIVVIGGGGHARVLISILLKNNDYEMMGYTDKIDNDKILGIPYLGNDEVLESFFKQDVKNAAIGLGIVNISEDRKKFIENIKRIGFNFPSIISNSAIINQSTLISEGTHIFDGVIINSGSQIGSYSIINTGSIIEHDCEIGNNCHIAPGAVLSGSVKLGNNSMIGAGAIIIPNIKISEKVMVGAGSVVIKDIYESGTYVGNPTRKIN